MSLLHLANNDYIYSGFSHVRTKNITIELPKGQYNSNTCGNYVITYSNYTAVVWELDTGRLLGNIRWVHKYDFIHYNKIQIDNTGHIEYANISNDTIIINSIYSHNIYVITLDTFDFGDIILYHNISNEQIMEQNPHIIHCNICSHSMYFSIHDTSGNYGVNMYLADRMDAMPILIYDLDADYCSMIAELDFEAGMIVYDDYAIDREIEPDRTRFAANVPHVIPYHTADTTTDGIAKFIYTYILRLDPLGRPVEDGNMDNLHLSSKHLFIQLLDVRLKSYIKCDIQTINIDEQYVISSAYEIGRNMMFAIFNVYIYNTLTRSIGYIIDTKHGIVISSQVVPTDATHCGLSGYLRYRCVIYDEIDEFNLTAAIPAKYLPDMYVSHGITKAQHTYNTIIQQLHHNMDTTHHKKHNGYLAVPKPALRLIAEML
jgi:hypothetical protein